MAEEYPIGTIDLRTRRGDEDTGARIKQKADETGQAFNHGIVQASMQTSMQVRARSETMVSILLSQRLRNYRRFSFRP